MFSYGSIAWEDWKEGNNRAVSVAFMSFIVIGILAGLAIEPPTLAIVAILICSDVVAEVAGHKVKYGYEIKSGPVSALVLLLFLASLLSIGTLIGQAFGHFAL